MTLDVYLKIDYYRIGGSSMYNLHFVIQAIVNFVMIAILCYFGKQIMDLRYNIKKSIGIMFISILVEFGMSFTIIWLQSSMNMGMASSYFQYLIQLSNAYAQIHFLFKADWKWHLIFLLLNLSAGYLSELLSESLVNLIFLTGTYYYSDIVTAYFVKILLNILCYVPMMYMFTLFWKAKKNSILSYGDVCMVCIPPFITVFAIFCLYNPLSIYKEPNIYLFLTFILLLCSNLMTCYVYPKIMQKNQLVAENRFLNDQLQKETQYYQAMVERYDEQKAMRHDITKHMNVITTMLEQKEYVEAQTYIQEYTRQFAKQRVYRTGIHPLDILLTTYEKRIQERHIQVDTQECHPLTLPLSAIDCTIILGNILENAICSCEQSQNKEIQIVCKQINQNLLLMEVINSCDQVKQTGDVFVSSKQDGGHGLINIQRTAIKNYGEVTFQFKQEEHKFYSILLFHPKGEARDFDEPL